MYLKSSITDNELKLFVGSNVGLGLTRDIGVMMFLRFVQATGCASMGSIGAGIIADIAPAKDRGGYLGMFSGSEFSLITLSDVPITI